MKKINLRLRAGENGGLLYVSEKIDDYTYDCLAVVTVNEDCYKKLVKLQGDFKK